MALNPPHVFTAITPQTAAAVSQIIDAMNYDSITVAADNLAGGEEVQLLVVCGFTNKQVTDIYGTAINLTATVASVALEGGARYVMSKGVTAGICGAYFSGKQV